MKKYPGPLIRPGAGDRVYTNLRDVPRLQADRERVEQLWAEYWPIADEEFYVDLPLDFAARFWEMDVACEVMGKGLVLEERRRIGPDIALQLSHDRRAWIEAVCATDGDGPDRSPDLTYQHVTSLNRPAYFPVHMFTGEDGILLRLRSVIEGKHVKYQKYLADGVVKPDEPYVVAVNGARVSASIIDEGLPWIVKSVYPFGAEMWRLNLGTEAVTVEHLHRRVVTKASQAQVATDIFLNPEYAGISGVVWSRADALNRRRDYVFVHNKMASNPLPVAWLKAGAEFWPEGDELHRTDWEPETDS